MLFHLGQKNTRVKNFESMAILDGLMDPLLTPLVSCSEHFLDK